MNETVKKSVYLDYAATTPLDPRVLSQMAPYFENQFGNTASEHEWGWAAQDAAEKSRTLIAEHLGAKAREIFFTSGATESNNWAIRGVVEQIKINEPSLIPHVLASPIEHACVLESCKWLEKLGQIELEFLPLQSSGQIDLQKAASLFKANTRLVAAIWVHNELGVVNPIHQLGSLCREKKVLFLTDGTQALGKFKIQLKNLNVDLVSFSGHKIYGPKGIGGLWIREPSLIAPLMCGGGHERGLRSGTLNVPGIVGLASALEFANKEMSSRNRKLIHLSKQFLKILISHFGPQLKVSNLSASQYLEALEDEDNFQTQIESLSTKDADRAIFSKLPHIHLLSLENAKSADVASSAQKQSKGAFGKAFIPFLGVSRGSACKNQDPNKLPVLAQLGCPTSEVKSAFRVSLSHLTEITDIEFAAQQICCD